MISVNSNGQALSAGFITALTDDNTEYQARLLDNGTVLDCAITRITVTKGSCGSEEAFSIGNIVGSTLVADVKGLSTPVKGKELEVQIGVNVSGSFEYVTLGYFVVSEAPQTAYQTTITAYGATITRTGDAFTAPATQTLFNIASSIASSVSALAGKTISVSFDTGIDTTKVVTESMTGLTMYQALEVLASVVGGYAIDTYDGNIKICRFSDTPTLSRDTSTMRNLPVVEEDNFEINGVLCIVTPESDDGETFIPAVQYPANPTGSENLVFQNQYVTKSLYDAFLATLVGYQYRPATIGLTYGDPRLEGNDVLSVTDVNNEIYIIPCHMITHTFDGGFTTQVVAVTATPQENEVASGGSLTEQLSSISANTISARISAEVAQQSAESAQQSANQALQDAQTAQASAESAQQSADSAQYSALSANASANSALNQLSEVEKVVDVLTWITEHGEYAETSDTEVAQGKYYFEPIAPSAEEAYAELLDENDTEITDADSETILAFNQYDFIVVNPTGNENPSEMGWYELVSVDDAISNYVSSHLALDSSGLWLQTDGVESKVLLSADEGLVLYGSQGQALAKYGEGAIIGDENSFHVMITSQRLSFYRDSTNEVAYISGDKLYITQSVVLQQMDVGTPTSNGGLGQWSWKVHEVNGANNLYLKWLG